MATTEEVRDPLRLFRLIKFRHVTVIDLVPTFWRSCIAVLAQLDRQTREELLDNELRLILSASEVLGPELPKYWRRTLNQSTRLVNMYGTTETTGIVSTYEIPEQGDDSDTDLGAIPIGRPIAGVQCHVLDDDLQPVANGVGELYVSGATLARGYLNQPGLTERVFVSNGLTGNDHMRLYRTGDLCRRRPDGALEYLGRADQQIKIRGYRIEPGEVERVLNRHPAIRESVVAACEVNGDKRLIAYFVAVDNTRLPAVTELRRFLASYLPEPLVPTHFVQLEALPRTPNNKVERHVLRPLSFSGEFCSKQGAAVVSRLPTEQHLAKIWGDVLGVREVGMDRGFFELGGNSLLVLAVLSRILDEFGVRLSPLVFREVPSIMEMAAHIDELRRQVALQKTGG